MIFLESPGSLTFEIQDVPLLRGHRRARGTVTMIDNTWATPPTVSRWRLGVDVSIHAATKYVGGHSDGARGGDRERRRVAGLRENDDHNGLDHAPGRCLPGAARPADDGGAAGARPATAAPGRVARAPSPRSNGSSFPRSRAIRATRSGSATSATPRASSGSR